MPMDDALNGSQAYSGAFKLFSPMQALKDTEQLIDILHIKARAVVPHEQLYFISLAGRTANLDFGLVRIRVNLTALESRFTRTSLSMERSP